MYGIVFTQQNPRLMPWAIVKEVLHVGTAILQAEQLNLPEVFAFKFRGKKVKLVESGDSVIINPVKCSADDLYGMFESDGHEVDRFLARKREEEELEYENWK